MNWCISHMTDMTTNSRRATGTQYSNTGYSSTGLEWKRRYCISVGYLPVVAPVQSYLVLHYKYSASQRLLIYWIRITVYHVLCTKGLPENRVTFGRWRL